MNEQDKHAYVDGLLDPQARARIEAELAASPEEAARVRAWQQQNELLRAKFDPVLDEPVPERLLLVHSRRPWLAYGIAAGWLVVGIAVGWLAAGMQHRDRATDPTSFARRAAVAHAVFAPEVRHPVEVGAAEQEHLVRWLSKRLGSDLKAPLLQPLGYELVGGRLLSGEAGPVAQFMYQEARGQRLTLYVTSRREPRDTAFRFTQEGRVSVFYWIDGKLGYALSGELDKAALLKVATSVYQQLNP